MAPPESPPSSLFAAGADEDAEGPEDVADGFAEVAEEAGEAPGVVEVIVLSCARATVYAVAEGLAELRDENVSFNRVLLSGRKALSKLLQQMLNWPTTPVQRSPTYCSFLFRQQYLVVPPTHPNCWPEGSPVPVPSHFEAPVQHTASGSPGLQQYHFCVSVSLEHIAGGMHPYGSDPTPVPQVKTALLFPPLPTN